MNQIELLRYTRQHMRANLRSLIFQWFPGGNTKGGGDDYWAPNHVRGEQEANSFHVNLASGKYYDHGATQVKGNDPLRLYAYLHGFIGSDFSSDDFTAMVNAAKHYCSHHGIDVGGDVSVPKPTHVPFVRNKQEPKETPLWLIKQITKDWNGLLPAAENPLAKAYFANRGLKVPKEARFLKSRDFDDGTYPCIVWAYTSSNGELRTLQYVRLFQDDNGKWWHKGRRFRYDCTLTKDAVVRFPAKNLNCKVYAIGEGVETCLSFKRLFRLIELGYKPTDQDFHVWARGNHKNMASVELPSDAEFIYIIGDNDGAQSDSRKSANKLLERCKNAGIKCEIVRPRLSHDGTKWDWNNELMLRVKRTREEKAVNHHKESLPQETLEELIKRHFKGACLDKSRCGGKFYNIPHKRRDGSLETVTICVAGTTAGVWYNDCATASGNGIDSLLKHLEKG